VGIARPCPPTTCEASCNRFSFVMIEIFNCESTEPRGHIQNMAASAASMTRALSAFRSSTKKLLTLLLVCREGQVLLGMKKRGFGKGECLFLFWEGANATCRHLQIDTTGSEAR
jgi:hypothetical protein